MITNTLYLEMLAVVIFGGIDRSHPLKVDELKCDGTQSFDVILNINNTFDGSQLKPTAKMPTFIPR